MTATPPTPQPTSLADALKASLAAVIEFGPCRCDGCRFEPTPTHLTDGLCGMCVEDGCELAPPSGEATGSEAKES
jgi:hypothetical protein